MVSEKPVIGSMYMLETVLHAINQHMLILVDIFRCPSLHRFTNDYLFWRIQLVSWYLDSCVVSPTFFVGALLNSITLRRVHA